MGYHRFFLNSDLPEGDSVMLPLSDADLHHARDVSRIKAGERIEAVAPGGQAWLTEVVSEGPDGLLVTRVRELAATPERHVTLVQGVAKGDKMDAIVRQAVEIGAEKIIPVLTARSVVKIDAGKRGAKGERWRRIAKSAAEQAHRAAVPEVLDPIELSQARSALAGYDAVFVLWEDAHELGLFNEIASRCEPDRSIALIVGPEGGLAPEEVEMLESDGAKAVTLGPSILRTETAAVVALALALQALGGLDESRG